MCGIAGLWERNGRPIDRDLLQRMTDVIAHRGPDGEGHHVDDGIGLGHRRLAIIDTSDAGRQPMSTPDGRWWIVYNGEVYNFQELRAELGSLGHTFVSRTDTEVVLHAWIEWGEAALERFNGMFAFALWDKETRRLVLVRDRYGIKPLYHQYDGETFRFASEVKAIVEDERVARSVDLVALRDYFTFQNVYSDRTLFEGVRLLPAGHLIEIDTREGTIDTRQWWDFDLADPQDESEIDLESAAKQVQEAMRDAVHRQLVSDVPLGSFLSGGMDSGSIVALASERIPRLKTFTGGFDMAGVDGFETAFDERRPAEAMSSHFGVEQYQMVMHAGDMRWVLPRLVYHLEDLRLGMCWQNYYIERLASRFVKVCLSGAGGDELFAGYPWRYRTALQGGEGDLLERSFSYWQRLVPVSEHDAFFTKEVMKATADHDPKRTFVDVFERPGADVAPLNRILYFELKTFLAGLFVISDKLSMAHSLEVRVPFLDDDLVVLASRLPPVHKWQGDGTAAAIDENVPGMKEMYFREHHDGKLVLRRSMAGVVPEDILERKKQGFSPPDASWYRGQSYDYIRDLLLDERTKARGYIRPDAVARILDEHLSGRKNHRLLLWSLLVFELWCRIWLDREVPPHEDA